MRTTYQLLTLILLSYFFLNCGGSDDATPVTDPIDPVEKKTYEADVKSIVDTHCISCHKTPLANGAPMPLETFQEVKNAMQNRDMIGRISTTNTLNIMPPAGKMSDADINAIVQWEKSGLPEK